MNLSWIDWTIVIILFTALNMTGWICKRYSKGVADFLVAGRSVGRYLGVGSDAMSGLAAVTILAIWQMCYQAGIAGNWWYLMKFPLGIILALTGWGIYRFRQTKAMTIPQYLEMRYSRRFRIFSGVLAYAAGILNMGIFPIIGAGFFVYFCGLPAETHIGSFTIPTVVLIMIILQATAVALCFMGGQVTLIVTDFLQGVFVSLMFIAIVFIIYHMFTWQQVVETYTAVPNGTGLLHPFKSVEATNFSVWFFIIDAFWLVYNVISWSPGTMQVGSAKDAHEAKMMKVMGSVRLIAVLGLGLFLLPYAAFVMLNHPDFAVMAAKVNASVETISNPQVRSQMIVPVAVAQILPVGLIGAFTAVVMFAFIACHDVYLLAWGGILVQDIIIPLRGKPLKPKTHIWLLRISILASATFTVIWSMMFNQVDDIFMYFDITASIYLSGAGIVILGGMYWKRGTTTAAWVSMITGSVLAGAGFILKSIFPETLPNGRYLAIITIGISVALYFIVSLFTKDPGFDLDAMLHRKPGEENYGLKRSWFKFGPEFSRFDKALYISIIAAVASYFIVFVFVTIYNLTHDVPVAKWIKWWHFYFFAMFFGGSIFLIWITIGGIRDLIRMFRHLGKSSVDVTDDGWVSAESKEQQHQNISLHSIFILFLAGSFFLYSFLDKKAFAASKYNPKSYVVHRATAPIEPDAEWEKPCWKSVPALKVKNVMGKKPGFVPNVEAKLLYDNENLYVIWRVKDKFIRAVAEDYAGQVWSDSCVEFFFYPERRYNHRLFQS